MAHYRMTADIPDAIRIYPTLAEDGSIDAAAVDAAVAEVATQEGDTSVELWDRRGVRIVANLPAAVTANPRHWKDGLFAAPSGVLDVVVEADSAADAGSAYLTRFRDWPFPFGGLSVRVRLPADVVTDGKSWTRID